VLDQEPACLALAAAARLERHDLDLDKFQPTVELAPAVRVVGEREGDVERVDVDVEPGGAAIDAGFRDSLNKSYTRCREA
jgi:hypothetical protein